MNTQPKLKLRRVAGFNAYTLPESIRPMFPSTSANDPDCVPVSEQTVQTKQSHSVRPRFSVVK